MSANVMYGAFVIWDFTLPHWLQGQIQGRGLPPPPYFWTKLRPEGRPPPTLSKGLHSPQSAIHNRYSSLYPDRDYHQSSNFEITSFFIRKNFLEIKLLGVITDLKPFNLVKKIGNKGHWNDLNFLNCNLAWNQTCLIAYSQRLKSLRKSIWDFLPHQRYPTTSYPSQCSWCV